MVVVMVVVIVVVFYVMVVVAVLYIDNLWLWGSVVDRLGCRIGELVRHRLILIPVVIVRVHYFNNYTELFIKVTE